MLRPNCRLIGDLDSADERAPVDLMPSLHAP
jgi:hypothetical protein